ncbi:hypothetical protein KIW84_076925 [Lathyrus oleraceus]|uniref:Uncharacterized protein n=1 Tax=Pisum sativum TaxID=3888 RepID=A0A9D4VZC1_PEA|nr:hypothetical protein KIW84_076925 [Pisum sativum]
MMIGNSYGNSNIQVSTRLNHQNVIVASKNEHKHELFVTTRYSTGGGGTGGGGARGGGGGMGGGTSGGSARAGGVVGGVATGMIGGRAIYEGDVNERNNYSYNFATTLSTGTHIYNTLGEKQRKLILKLPGWLLSRKKLIEEAKIDIQHAETARAMRKEVDGLKIEDSMNEKKLRLAKMRFEKMKIDFPF